MNEVVVKTKTKIAKTMYAIWCKCESPGKLLVLKNKKDTRKSLLQDIVYKEAPGFEGELKLPKRWELKPKSLLSQMPRKIVINQEA